MNSFAKKCVHGGIQCPKCYCHKHGYNVLKENCPSCIIPKKCSHNNYKNKCKYCSVCFKCKKTGITPKKNCKICPTINCIHGLRRRNCVSCCDAKEFCVHLTFWFRCKHCKTNKSCTVHNHFKINCEKCKDINSEKLEEYEPELIEIPSWEEFSNLEPIFYNEASLLLQDAIETWHTRALLKK